MVEHIDAFLFSKSNFKNWINLLIKEYDVWGPSPYDGEDISLNKFKQLKNAEELNINYITTFLSPKKIFFKPLENLFTYHSKQGYKQTAARNNKKTLILGMHSCDLHGLLILDLAFKNIKGDFSDPYYLKRRENNIIIAFNCTQVGEYCFCSSFKTGPFVEDMTSKGVDLLFTDLDDKFLVEVGSLEGSHIAQNMQRTSVMQNNFKEKEESYIKTLKKFTRSIPADKIDRLIKESPNHPVWKENGDICVSCGSCTNVCPTCFCFRVQHRLDWDFETSLADRHWDSCQIYDFAEVAMKENFRSKRPDRVRQWVSHKLSNSKDQYGVIACVGCGRCIENCVVKIDISEIANRIVSSG